MIISSNPLPKYLDTRYSNLFPRKERASSDVPLKSFKLNTSTARERAAAIAIAGAPRTTISRIADLRINSYIKNKNQEAGSTFETNFKRNVRYVYHPSVVSRISKYTVSRGSFLCYNNNNCS